MNKGWIYLHRSLLDWEWYDDINVRLVFVHCLLKANFIDKNHKGDVIKRGTFATSLEILAKETGLSIMQVRNSLNKLKRTNDITNASSRKGRIISITNYDKYQTINKHDNRKETNDLTGKEQESNRKATSTKELNKGTKEENKEKVSKDTKKKPDPLKPENASQTIWDDFVAYRKQMKKPLTLTAVSRIVNEAEKAGVSIDEALSETQARGWQGFKADWYNKDGFKKQKREVYNEKTGRRELV